jgi:hypothetical protein
MGGLRGSGGSGKIIIDTVSKENVLLLVSYPVFDLLFMRSQCFPSSAGQRLGLTTKGGKKFTLSETKSGA